ncbi:N-acetylmuramoyl-L-alanine amidase [Flavobacterium sp. DSR2-3-3]|uniref:N-acetylmuramoyl-L-alanine amidase n=1 Tax=Flavobacterium sp. DSR2-3-3 TaxID=2804632 RepID=UPI003CFA4458
MKNLRLFLDAGNRCKEPSNSSHYFFKKEITLKTTLKLDKYGTKDNDFKVVYTVKSGVVTELKDRPKKANFIDSYLFVSVHCKSILVLSINM